MLLCGMKAKKVTMASHMFPPLNQMSSDKRVKVEGWSLPHPACVGVGH